MARTKPAPPERKPANFQTTIQALGLSVVSYRSSAVECDDGERLWLPRDIVGKDGKTLIVFRCAGRESGYDVDGYHPWHDGMFGGCYPAIGAALAWVQRAQDIRAGKETDFLGR